jgi:hypothetical protein
MPDPTTTKTDAQGQEAPASKPKTVWVVLTRSDDRGWWERDTDHPDTDLYLNGKVPSKAALTSEVNAKLRMGELREATPEEISKREAQLGAVATAPAKGAWD